MESNNNVDKPSANSSLLNKKRKARDDAVGVATKNKKKHAITCATDGCKNKEEIVERMAANKFGFFVNVRLMGVPKQFGREEFVEDTLYWLLRRTMP